MKVREVLGRGDYALISSLIPEGARVLDLGCGDGALLGWLAANKRIEGRGIEIRPDLAQRAAARGVAVYQGDLESSLAEYPDGAFDYVILSQTLQELRRPLEVLEQMLRIGRHAVVAFPNFGHWRVRLNHLWSGRAPRTPLFPHAWHSSPNIHFLTVLDFEETVAEKGWRVETRLFLSGHSQIRFAPNWRAEIAVYLLKR
ncbi:MAG: methionine biosynthesis protein MetW [Bryobacteraceae bacterium]